jgi:hypothetical protein
MPLHSLRSSGVESRAERMERRFAWPMVGASLLVIPTLVLEESALDHLEPQHHAASPREKST